MKKSKRTASIPSVVVVIAFLAFWPLGIVLLLIKLGSDRSATLKEGVGKTMKAVSVILLAMGTIAAFMGIMQGEIEIVFGAALFGTGGVVLWIFATRMKKTGALYKKYISNVVNQGHTDIRTIAANMGVKYSEAVVDLQKMINSGYFQKAQLDAAKGTITLTQPQSQGGIQFGPFQLPFQQQQAQAQVPEARAFVCHSCGANIRVNYGTTAECEYCGALVSWDALE